MCTKEKRQPWWGAKPYEIWVGGRWRFIRAENLVFVVVVLKVEVVYFGERSLSVMEVECLRVGLWLVGESIFNLSRVYLQLGGGYRSGNGGLRIGGEACCEVGQRLLGAA